MGAYILRRLLLVIPTLFGVMLINFALTQFVPGGPVEQVLARLEGEGDAIQSLAGTEGGGVQEEASGGGYVGSRGLPPEFLAKLEVQFGFARIVCDEGFTGTPSLTAPECRKEAIPATERFFIMMWNYLTLDFGESYFRSIGVSIWCWRRCRFPSLWACGRR